MVKGSCLCGSVAFSLTGKMRDIIACHCTQCRKQSGHFWAATSVAERDLNLESKEGLTWFRASDKINRGFCENCGSTLFYKPDAEARIVVSAGCLENGSGLNISRHAFIADKGDYYEIADDLPTHDQFTGIENE